MNKKEKQFVNEVLAYYRENGRQTLPWRQTHDPYKIFVSEIMLQQTQVERVIPKYNAFIEHFPTVTALAEASLAAVLILWQGLGYNRRAKYLHECAKQVVKMHGGLFPSSESDLRALPGVGAYTAGAIMAFAYNVGLPIVETNIRTVYIHHFFRNKSDVHDREIMVLLKQTLPEQNARAWYYALMDYGSHLKRSGHNKGTSSSQYKKQATFAGSNRQLRGTIVRLLTQEIRCTKQFLYKNMGDFTPSKINEQLLRLGMDGLIVKNGRTYQLAT